MDIEKMEGMLGALHSVTSALLLELSDREPDIVTAIQTDLTNLLAQLQNRADPGSKTFRVAIHMQAEIDKLFNLGHTPASWRRKDGRQQ